VQPAWQNLYDASIPQRKRIALISANPSSLPPSRLSFVPEDWGRLSSAIVNVGWGAFNIVVGYVLVLRVGTFDLIGTLSARLFGPFHGGDMKGSHEPSP
jgi:hypothetical protein